MPKMMPKSRLGKGGVVAVAAILLVGTWEGLKTVAYKDVVGVPTVCYGETRGVHMGDRYTKAQCDEMLGDGLKDFEAAMNRCLDHPERIPDKSYVAFISFTYNVGPGNFCSSTLHRRVNESTKTDPFNKGLMTAACNELRKWNKAGGRVVKGLTRRRAEERTICLEGVKEGTITLQ